MLLFENFPPNMGGGGGRKMVAACDISVDEMLWLIVILSQSNTLLI